MAWGNFLFRIARPELSGHDVCHNGAPCLSLRLSWPIDRSLPRVNASCLMSSTSVSVRIWPPSSTKSIQQRSLYAAFFLLQKCVFNLSELKFVFLLSGNALLKKKFLTMKLSDLSRERGWHRNRPFALLPGCSEIFTLGNVTGR